MTRDQKLQAFLRYYRERTGETDLDMHKVAEAAERQGWKMPKPETPQELLAKEFSRAARVEVRKDKVTGQPYRANHAYPTKHGQMTLWLWVDIDQAPRKTMVKCLVQRREQMVGDGLQLSRDADHWNSIHPEEEPIQIPLDLTDDVEWRKNAPHEDDEEQAAS